MLFRVETVILTLLLYRGDGEMGLTIYEQKIIDQFHNDIKMRLPEATEGLEKAVAQLTVNTSILEDYMIVEAIKLDRELPKEKKVFTIEEEQKCLQLVKEHYLNSTKR